MRLQRSWARSSRAEVRTYTRDAPKLFGSIHRAKPQIHCYGHIHEAWGAYLARWKQGDEHHARVESVVDGSRSRYIRKLSGLRPNEVVYDAKLNAEKQRALVLLELLMRGETSVPEEVGAAARQCSSPDCRETTLGVYCPSCELRHG